MFESGLFVTSLPRERLTVGHQRWSLLASPPDLAIRFDLCDLLAKRCFIVVFAPFSHAGGPSTFDRVERSPFATSAGSGVAPARSWRGQISPLADPGERFAHVSAVDRPARPRQYLNA